MEAQVTDGAEIVAKKSTPIIRDVQVLLRRGIDLIERNHFEEAAGVLHQASELEPDLAMIYLALGIALGRLLRIPEAMAALEKAAELDPKGFYPRFRLGELYMRVGVPTRAREELQHALDLSTKLEERKMVRELLAVDTKREAKRAWRPDFLRLVRNKEKKEK